MIGEAAITILQAFMVATSYIAIMDVAQALVRRRKKAVRRGLAWFAGSVFVAKLLDVWSDLLELDWWGWVSFLPLAFAVAAGWTMLVDWYLKRREKSGEA